jgi:hypothetical protein
MRWRYSRTQMREYWFEGGWVTPGLVRHHWPCDNAMVMQTVCYLGPHAWVVELEESTEDAIIEYSLYRLAPDEVRAMLTRYGHGPDLWSCACDACVCDCGLTWHNHPTFHGDLHLLGASCPRLAGFPALAPEWPEAL